MHNTTPGHVCILHSKDKTKSKLENISSRIDMHTYDGNGRR